MLFALGAAPLVILSRAWKLLYLPRKKWKNERFIFSFCYHEVHVEKHEISELFYAAKKA